MQESRQKVILRCRLSSTADLQSLGNSSEGFVGVMQDEREREKETFTSPFSQAYEDASWLESSAKLRCRSTVQGTSAWWLQLPGAIHFLCFAQYDPDKNMLSRVKGQQHAATRSVRAKYSATNCSLQSNQGSFFDWLPGRCDG